jgi:hypothetical protein
MNIDPVELARYNERVKRIQDQKCAPSAKTEWEEVLRIAREYLPEVTPPMPYEPMRGGAWPTSRKSVRRSSASA